MSNFATSLIRTYVPIVVGALLSYLAAYGFELDADTKLSLITAMTAVLQAAYYFVARVLERKYPQLSFLLGSTTQPKYVEKK